MGRIKSAGEGIPNVDERYEPDGLSVRDKRLEAVSDLNRIAHRSTPMASKDLVSPSPKGYLQSIYPMVV